MQRSSRCCCARARAPYPFAKQAGLAEQAAEQNMWLSPRKYGMRHCGTAAPTQRQPPVPPADSASPLKDPDKDYTLAVPRGPSSLPAQPSWKVRGDPSPLIRAGRGDFRFDSATLPHTWVGSKPAA